MNYRTFPKTNLTASEVGFGVWTLTAGWWGSYTDNEAMALLRKAFDLGVTFFDTADTYGNGRGEEIMPKALGKQRHQIVLSTKVGYDFYNHTGPRTGQREWPQDWSREFVRFACDQSLKRLGTDYIDLYQLHNARMDAIDSDELFATLEELKREGKVRHYGVALGPAIGWRDEGLAAMRHRDIPVLGVVFSDAAAEEDELLVADNMRTIAEIGQVQVFGRLRHCPDPGKARLDFVPVGRAIAEALGR